MTPLPVQHEKSPGGHREKEHGVVYNVHGEYYQRKF